MSDLHDLLARKDLTTTTKYLIILASSDEPLKVSAINAVAHDHGWRAGAKGQASAFLGKTRHAVLVPAGWRLTRDGRDYLEQQGLVAQTAVLTPIAAKLSKYASGIKDPDNARFVAEAVGCLRASHYRAAIVLSWVGALHLLYQHVLAKHLRDFNSEAQRRNPKSKPVKALDDLAKMKEVEFLSIIEAIGVITKAQGKELGNCLDRRNTAGHPNSHTFREVTVGSHIETLMGEVFSRF